CYLLIRHPPTPTLFPYTTLFRSHERLRIDACHTQPCKSGCRRVACDCPDRVCACGRYRGSTQGRLSVPYDETGTARQAAQGGPQDRKSTRLNSSHVKISYAVFCL